MLRISSVGGTLCLGAVRLIARVRFAERVQRSERLINARNDRIGAHINVEAEKFASDATKPTAIAQ